MSIYGAMMTGVAGLGAYSNALSVASANIANVNTVGYKTATANFSTLLASASSAADPSTAGVVCKAGQSVGVQGLLQPTSSPTDLAISGSGFFVVGQTTTDTTARAYTRAGSFSPDPVGYLKNTSGLYLLGWKLDESGDVPSDRNDMIPINVNSLAGKAEATTKMGVQINLQASTDSYTGSGATAYDPLTFGMSTLDGTGNVEVKADFQRTINVYDSQGGSQPLQLSYLKTGANTWSYEVTYQGSTGAGGNLDNTMLPDSTNAPRLLQYGTVTFNSDGTLQGVSSQTRSAGPPVAWAAAASTDGSFNVTIPWNPATSGLQSQIVNINFGTLNSSEGVTQFDNSSTMVSSQVNGALFGSLSGITVDSEGIITAQFSNGLSQKVYKIPLATFANPDGLSETSGNAYMTSIASGSPTISEADLGGAGTIVSKNLEGSTVDLATEFTSLITTQRAYSAASRIVTTASTMLDDLLTMAR
jgi:flagellar hook protein FlgE